MTEPAPAAPGEPAVEPLRQPAVWRLIFCAVLFVLWLVYLGSLVALRPEVPTGPRQLSRPQALVSTLDVIAQVDPKRPEVVVEEVLYPAGKEGLVGQKLLVTNLLDCGVRARGGDFTADIAPDGPRSYLLLLRADEARRAEVVALPPSPGFSRDPVNPRAYAATPDILGQYRQVVKPGRP